jgi:hypothetical protein
VISRNAEQACHPAAFCGKLPSIEAVIEVLLWLFVINLGIAFGAGLYESRIVVPQWLSFSRDTGYRWNAEAARNADVGLRFWVYVTTLPLTLLTFASLIVAWWTPSVVRNWWLAAAAAAAVDRAMTLSYFIPTMIKLMGDEVFEQSDAVTKALRWVRLSYIRHAATLVAWLAALKALSLINSNAGG